MYFWRNGPLLSVGTNAQGGCNDSNPVLWFSFSSEFWTPSDSYASPFVGVVLQVVLSVVLIHIGMELLQYGTKVRCQREGVFSMCNGYVFLPEGPLPLLLIILLAVEAFWLDAEYGFTGTSTYTWVLREVFSIN